MSHLLVVDDEATVRFTLEEILTAHGHTVTCCASGADALAALDGGLRVDVVLSDLAMPGMDGLALLAAIRERDPSLPVILLTARGSERVAVQAMKAGAHDYVTKPYGIDELLAVLARAAETRALRLETRALRVRDAVGGDLVGESPAFRRLLDEARRVAPRDVTVLVRGETGTGKEAIASFLHGASTRASGPLVRFNCAALAPELAEAELFGHAKGAFTGAHGSRRGFFQEADGGTLVLDEVGDLPVAIQPKLLRAVQQGEVQPVGSTKVTRVDTRVIACTHRDLRALSRTGAFREDLYYRLAVVELVVPPLRERREDVPLLVQELVSRWAKRFRIEDASFSPALVDALARRTWPGNVRELENAVARLLALSPGGEVHVDALAKLAADAPEEAGPDAPLREQVGAFERSVLVRALEGAGGNRSETARRLGITRVTLLDKMKRYGIP